MKLHTRKSDSLSFIFLIFSLSVLAYSAYTIIWPIQSDFSGNGPSNECLTDTLTRGKLPLSDTAYANALQRADMFLKANKPEACLAELEQAKKLRPEDKTLNSRIAQVRGMISGNKKKQADMLTSVVSGDAAFQKKDYLNAKAYYQLALNLFPTDSLVKDKLKKTMDLLRSQKAQNTLFDVAVANADRLFQAGEYDRAKEEYENASRLIPSEQYPKQKINEIIKIKVDQQFEDGMYSEAILNADKYYNAKNWQPALLEYQNAQKIRPQEKYPKDRIAELIPLIAAQRSRDEAYIKLIASADQLFSDKLYLGARKDYDAASKIKPDQPYPKNKIAEIDGLLAKMGKTQKDYEQYISLADSFYIEKNFIRARDYYTLASGVKPGENYPKEMLVKVKPLIAGQEAGEKAKEEAYLSAIAIADQEFISKNYEQAKKEYQRGLAIKPAEAYPKSRITTIDKIIADQQQAALVAAAAKAREAEKQTAELARLKKLDDDYNAAVKKGDSLLGTTQYAQAKTAFTEAAALKPAEAYPKAKLAQISTAQAELAKRETLEKERLEKQQALDKQYLAAITAADKLLATKSYPEAKTQYTAALALKPGEAYPGTKIAEINKILEQIAKQQALDSEYSTVMASAETLFKTKSYEPAKPEYQKALVLKPDQPLPKQRITSIDSIAEALLKQKSLDDQYTALITNADKLLAAKTYDQAKAEYQKASVLKPTEAYPKTKIQEIDKQLAELARLKKLDDDYNAAVKKGDSLLGATQYAQAKTAFTEAAALKPAEAYPKAKLAQINTAQAELAKREALEKERLEKQQALDSQYQAAIAEADKLLGEHSLGGAKAKYTSALTLKPSEAYPKSRIAEIDKTVTDSIQKQKALDLQYAGLIRNADQLLLAKTYGQAKAEYGKASGLKPSEEYPKEKISEIEKALADIAATKARDSAYSAVIADADKLLASKLFEQAKAEYQKALQFKADDLYVKTKIGEIDRAVAEIAQQKATIENRYKSSITKADQLLAAKSYEQAKAEYNTALGIKGGEQYPQDKIKEINTILSELKAKEDAYKASIAKADQLLFEKKFEEARTEYENSLSIKPNEQYPKNKVDEINKKLSELQGRKKTFDDLVLKGDNSLNGKDYGKAREFFQQAMALFPEETYPRNQLNRVNSVIDSIYRANKGKYDKAIVEADKFYNGFEFDKAIDAYTDASVLLPMENYPKEMITRIHRTIAENAIADVLNSPVTISSNNEKQFKFTPLNVASRKDNFIYIKLRNLSGKPFNVLLRYGKDKQPSGGVVIRNLSADGKVNERLISVREQDVWYRIDNDYISLYPQGGDIEVSFIQVSKAR